MNGGEIAGAAVAERKTCERKKAVCCCLLGVLAGVRQRGEGCFVVARCY
jgi:hypothetical protein